MTPENQQKLFEFTEEAAKIACKGGIMDVKFARYLDEVELFGDYTVEKLEKIIEQLKRVNKFRKTLMAQEPKQEKKVEEIKDKIRLV